MNRNFIISGLSVVSFSALSWVGCGSLDNDELDQLSNAQTEGGSAPQATQAKKQVPKTDCQFRIDASGLAEDKLVFTVSRSGNEVTFKKGSDEIDANINELAELAKTQIKFGAISLSELEGLRTQIKDVQKFIADNDERGKVLISGAAGADVADDAARIAVESGIDPERRQLAVLKAQERTVLNLEKVYILIIDALTRKTCLDLSQNSAESHGVDVAMVVEGLFRLWKRTKIDENIKPFAADKQPEWANNFSQAVYRLNAPWDPFKQNNFQQELDGLIVMEDAE